MLASCSEMSSINRNLIRIWESCFLGYPPLFDSIPTNHISRERHSTTPLPSRIAAIPQVPSLKFKNSVVVSCVSLISRKAFIKIFVLACAVQLPLSIKSAQSAVVSIEEYNDPSAGAKKKRGGFVLDANKKSNKEISFNNTWNIDSAGKFRETAQSALKQLDILEILISVQAWDDIRVEIQSGSLSYFFFKKNWEPASSQDLIQSVLGVDKFAATYIYNIRRDICTELKQLDDYSFTNRVIYFNLEDKKQVFNFKSNLPVDGDVEQNVVDLEEPKQMVENVSALLNELLTFLSN